MIRAIIILFLSGFFLPASSQDFSLINEQLSLSDSLKHREHIRIYKSHGGSDKTTVFEMFNNQNSWVTFFYEYDPNDESRSKKTILNTKNHPDYIFQNFLRSYALEIPNQEKIEWKMKIRNDIVFVPLTYEGTIPEKYWDNKTSKRLYGQDSYTLQVNYLEKSNQASYYDPYRRNEWYPDVDELIYFCEILDIVKSEFGIWEEE